MVAFHQSRPLPGIDPVSVNPIAGNIIRLLVALLIVAVWPAHRRVRLERAKGPEALYAKAMTHSG